MHEEKKKLGRSLSMTVLSTTRVLVHSIKKVWFRKWFKVNMKKLINKSFVISTWKNFYSNCFQERNQKTFQLWNEKLDIFNIFNMINQGWNFVLKCNRLISVKTYIKFRIKPYRKIKVFWFASSDDSTTTWNKLLS